jgi:ribosomal protein S14
MLFRKIKDLRVRTSFKNKEILNTCIKFVNTNHLNKIEHKSRQSCFIKIKHKNFSKTKIVRRCIHTNRARGSIRPYNISRVKLRELLQFGIIPGYKKSV